VKYSAKGEPTNNANATIGKVKNLATTLCNTLSKTRRPRGGRVRSARVTGAPRARKIGAIIPSSMCWIMCADSSTSS
jgi:hypothetical protein